MLDACRIPGRMTLRLCPDPRCTAHEHPTPVQWLQNHMQSADQGVLALSYRLGHLAVVCFLLSLVRCFVAGSSCEVVARDGRCPGQTSRPRPIIEERSLRTECSPELRIGNLLGRRLKPDPEVGPVAGGARSLQPASRARSMARASVDVIISGDLDLPRLQSLPTERERERAFGRQPSLEYRGTRR